MSVHSFESNGLNEELRMFKKHNYQVHAQQKSAFKKILDIGISIDIKDHKIFRMIQLGIPSTYRQIFWPKMMDNVHGITINFYQILLNKANKLMSVHPQQVGEEKQKIVKHLNSIEQDIERTFPQLKIFRKQNQQGQSLFNILSAWTVFRQQLGYLQGMSQIAGYLLVELKQLYIMTTDIIYAYYSMDMEQMLKFQYAFDQRLKRGADKIYHKFKQLQIQHRNYIFSWIITLFTRLIDLQSIGKLWDILFLHQIDQIILIQTCFLFVCHFRDTILDPSLESQQIIQQLKSGKLNQYETSNVLKCLRSNKRG